MTEKLKPDFYERPTLLVARNLIGKLLVRKRDHRRLSGVIVETEAYVGWDDRACHGSRGMTRRNSAMFSKAAHAYVYLVYGLYYCLNLVTERENYPSAVLIRAIKPVEGFEGRIAKVASGPGLVCRALDIDLKLNGVSLYGDKLFVENVNSSKQIDVAATPRIGVGYAGEYARLPWRFVAIGSPYSSSKLIAR
ncbi:MAG: DNA-3-methyladenine glycosylase [Actinobacteria bacterium]|nr:DNA-3-methyladenine glycosylase [Actinomycetota bacterium]